MRVIYDAPRCEAARRCDVTPSPLRPCRYAERQVAIGDLTPQRDRHLLDLCREHVERMTPPVGWTVHDARAEAPQDAPAVVAV
jgi:hypothetical protein